MTTSFGRYWRAAASRASRSPTSATTSNPSSRQQTHDSRTDENGVLRDDDSDGRSLRERQPLHGPRRDRGGDPLQRQRLDGLDLDIDERPTELADEIGDEHLAADSRVTEPAGDHHGESEDVGVVGHLDDVADVHPDTQAADPAVRPTCRGRTATFVLVGLLEDDRCAHRLGRGVEQRHHAVAERLRDTSTVGLDDLAGVTEVLGHLGRALRVARVDQVLRRLRHVGEDDRHGWHRSSLLRRRVSRAPPAACRSPPGRASVRSSGSASSAAEWIIDDAPADLGEHADARVTEFRTVDGRGTDHRPHDVRVGDQRDRVGRPCRSWPRSHPSASPHGDRLEL